MKTFLLAITLILGITASYVYLTGIVMGNGVM